MAEELSRAARSVIESGHYVLGTKVTAFEREFADYCGVSDCIGVANGTDALELALKGIGVEPGQQVIVCANAAMYGTSAVLACHANPVFVDVDLQTATLCPEALTALLASNREPVAAIIVTHLYGRLADMERICAVAEKYGISIVEDCAQAHGARDKNEKIAGSFGKAATFSFYPTKNLGAIGDGGAVVTSDRMVAERIRKLRQYGWNGKYQNELAGGRNSRLDEMQAALLSQLLPKLDQWNTRRRHIANLYSSDIRHEAIRTPDIAGADYVAHLYVIHSARRDELRDHLTAHGIGTDIHYPLPDYRQALFAGKFSGTALPNTEALCSSCLTLPCYPELGDDEIRRVIDVCKQF